MEGSFLVKGRGRRPDVPKVDPGQCRKKESSAVEQSEEIRWLSHFGYVSPNAEEYFYKAMHIINTTGNNCFLMYHGSHISVKILQYPIS